MVRRSPGFGSRYRCPDCEQTVPAAGRAMYGPFSAHPSCTVRCGICGEVIDRPRIGEAHRVEAWLNRPVHKSCKQQEMQAALATPITEGEENHG